MRSALVLLAIFLTCSLPLAAQQDAQFSMYMFNRMVLNPAYAGARGATNITSVGRTQWVGIDGHPNTFTISGDAPISVLHGGVGGHLMVDQIGPLQTLALKAAYAFRFNLQGADNPDGAALQLGIAPGFFRKQIDGTNFLPETQNDPRLVNIIGQTASGQNFDLGAGIWFNSNNSRIWAGVSIDHILEPSLVSSLTNSTLPRTIGLMVGGKILNPVTNPRFNVEPSVHYRMAGPQMQLEANVNFHVAPMVFGISYRGLQNVSDAVAIVGFNANQRLFIAYSYDYTFSALQNSTSGSHEILLSYTFPRFVRFFPPNLDTMDNPVVR